MPKKYFVGTILPTVALAQQNVLCSLLAHRLHVWRGIDLSQTGRACPR
ncbi:hypothetical protein [Erwinia endophytica]|nr:hypothetical protein [Erwinia endophytica]